MQSTEGGSKTPTPHPDHMCMCEPEIMKNGRHNCVCVDNGAMHLCNTTCYRSLRVFNALQNCVLGLQQGIRNIFKENDYGG
jgi:hypothetical protein